MCHLKYNSFVYCGQGAHNRLMSALQGKRKIGTQCFMWNVFLLNGKLQKLINIPFTSNSLSKLCMEALGLWQNKYTPTQTLCLGGSVSHYVGRYDLQFFSSSLFWTSNPINHLLTSQTAFNLVVGDKFLDGNEIMVHQPPSPQFMLGRSISNPDILEQLLFSHLWFPFPLF